MAECCASQMVIMKMLTKGRNVYAAFVKLEIAYDTNGLGGNVRCVAGVWCGWMVIKWNKNIS